MYGDSKALNDSIRSFIFSRQATLEDFKRAIMLTGMMTEYKQQKKLCEHYYEILKAELPPYCWHELDEYTSARNGVSAIENEAEYRRGVMDAFHIFKMLLKEDERRIAS